jgi:outer membrane protein OmpA-like peptidoglycan-associated protein
MKNSSFILFLAFLNVFVGFGQKDEYKLTKSCFNSTFDDFGVRRLSNQYYIVSASVEKDSTVRMDEESGKPFTDLYELSDCVRKDAYFMNATSQENWILSSIHNDGPISPNRYGNIVFFSHNNSKELQSKMGVYYLVKNGNAWNDAIPLPFNSTSYNIVHPFFDEQSNRLYFSSDMAGGKGGFDLYSVSFDGLAFGKIEAVDGVNSAKNELFPCFKDGGLYFTSNRDGGLGMHDIYVFHHAQVENLGPEINSAYDEVDMFFINEINGFVSSNRDTKGLTDDSYFFVRTKKEQLMVNPEALANASVQSKIDRSKETLEILNASTASSMMLDLTKSTMSDIVAKSEELSKNLTENTTAVFNKLNFFSDTLKEQILNNMTADYNKKMASISEMNRIIEALKTETDPAKIEALLSALENVMNEISPELTAKNHAQVEQIRENLMARVDILAKQADYDNKLTETSKIIFAEVIALPSSAQNDQLKDQLVASLLENLKNDALAPIQANINQNSSEQKAMEVQLMASLEEYIAKGQVKDPVALEKIEALLAELENTTDPVRREELLSQIVSLMQTNEPALFELNKGTLASLSSKNEEAKQLNQTLLTTNEKYNQSFNDSFAELAKNGNKLTPEQLKAEISKMNQQFGIDVSSTFYPDAPVISPEMLEEFLASHRPNNILFGFDSYELKSEYHKELKELMDFLGRYQQFQIFLDGHTDNVGRIAYNVKLSKNRANSVKSYLMKQGVKESSFVLTSHGLSNPAASNASKEGRRLNRRVEIRLVIR